MGLFDDPTGSYQDAITQAQKAKLSDMFKAAQDLQQYRGTSQNARVSAMNQQLGQYSGLQSALSSMYPGMPTPQIPKAQPLFDQSAFNSYVLPTAAQQQAAQQQKDAAQAKAGQTWDASAGSSTPAPGTTPSEQFEALQLRAAGWTDEQITAYQKQQQESDPGTQYGKLLDDAAKKKFEEQQTGGKPVFG